MGATGASLLTGCWLQKKHTAQYHFLVMSPDHDFEGVIMLFSSSLSCAFGLLFHLQFHHQWSSDLTPLQKDPKACSTHKLWQRSWPLKNQMNHITKSLPKDLKVAERTCATAKHIMMAQITGHSFVPTRIGCSIFRSCKSYSTHG